MYGNILHRVQDIGGGLPGWAQVGEISCILYSIICRICPIWANILHFVQPTLTSEQASKLPQSCSRSIPFIYLRKASGIRIEPSSS
ncbi:hypothetical protein EV294_104131 [Paenibacillus sp. BK033]|nr:hypothetical protein EV294_104131 [Paenibacillus sp. BK033]